MTRLLLALPIILVLGCAIEREKPVTQMSGTVIAIQDPDVTRYCIESLAHIDEDLHERQDIPLSYLTQATLDVYTLSTMSITDAGYAEMLTRVECEMWKIHELDKNDAI